MILKVGVLEILPLEERVRDRQSFTVTSSRVRYYVFVS